MIDFIFICLAIFAFVGAFGTVSLHQPIFSALSFILTIIAMAGLFALLSASFLFMVQLIVYAGAVITLLLFIIMFLNINEEQMPHEQNRFKQMAFGAIFLIPFNIAVYKAFGDLGDRRLDILQNDFGSIKTVGMKLFTDWILPFEMMSILLLVALVGSIVLAKKVAK